MPITHKNFETIGSGDIVQARIFQSTFEGLDGVHRWKVVKKYANSVSCRVDDVSHGLEVELNKLYVVSWRAIDKVVIRVPHAPKDDKPLAGIDRTRAHAMAATKARASNRVIAVRNDKDAGMTNEQLADKYHLTQHTLRSYLAKCGHTKEEVPRQQAEDVNWAMRLLREGKNQSEAAKTVGIGVSTLARYLAAAQTMTTDGSLPEKVDELPTPSRVCKQQRKERETALSIAKAVLANG
jgi:transposase